MLRKTKIDNSRRPYHSREAWTKRVSNVTRIQHQEFLEEAGTSAGTCMTGAGIVGEEGLVGLKSWRYNICRRRITVLPDLLLLSCSLNSSVFCHWTCLESNWQGNLNDMFCRPHFSAPAHSPCPLCACTPYNPASVGTEKRSHFAFFLWPEYPSILLWVSV